VRHNAFQNIDNFCFCINIWGNIIKCVDKMGSGVDDIFALLLSTAFIVVRNFTGAGVGRK
jgi:hypothetical protein